GAKTRHARWHVLTGLLQRGRAATFAAQTEMIIPGENQMDIPMASLLARSVPVCWCALAILLAPAVSSTVAAELKVGGNVNAVTVEMRDASVTEVLSVLGTTFGQRIRISKDIDRIVSGTYRGSLQRVIARLLAGSDYVATYSADGIDIIVIGSGPDP